MRKPQAKAKLHGTAQVFGLRLDLPRDDTELEMHGDPVSVVTIFEHKVAKHAPIGA
jgi:hypothetical protein